MIVVVHENMTDRRSINECVRLLRMSEAKVLGFVMTGVKESDSRYYRKYGHTYYSKYYREVPD